MQEPKRRSGVVIEDGKVVEDDKPHFTHVAPISWKQKLRLLTMIAVAAAFLVFVLIPFMAVGFIIFAVLIVIGIGYAAFRKLSGRPISVVKFHNFKP